MNFSGSLSTRCSEASKLGKQRIFVCGEVGEILPANKRELSPRIVETQAKLQQ
jgi:hypothetical protein